MASKQSKRPSRSSPNRMNNFFLCVSQSAVFRSRKTTFPSRRQYEDLDIDGYVTCILIDWVVPALNEVISLVLNLTFDHLDCEAARDYKSCSASTGESGPCVAGPCPCSIMQTSCGDWRRLLKRRLGFQPLFVEASIFGYP
jgi:hypothetical protein